MKTLTKKCMEAKETKINENFIVNKGAFRYNKNVEKLINYS